MCLGLSGLQTTPRLLKTAFHLIVELKENTVLFGD